MPAGKEQLRKRFSAEPDKYYRVELFKELGFIRKQCPNCKGFFWTLDSSRINCPEQPCEQYGFLGNSPMKEKSDYAQTWKKIQGFFERNGHAPIQRYPVVCRWRPDLYFTVASIVDFQRIESGKVVFEFPSNPLIVPQMCLRFLDIGNVGVTGRHYTSFCMVGQHALANSKGYWKDRCISLDFQLLTKEFGIEKDEVVFKEDVWLGPGAFGNSLEYYVKGLELGNAVFTAFEGTPDDYQEYPEKVIDMGAGLERIVWLSQGTFNSYDAVFRGVLDLFETKTGLRVGADRSLENYFRLAGSLDIDEFKGVVEDYSEIANQLGMDEVELRKKIHRIQAVYSIIDHTRTLLFGISDGMLPSNVGGGYNLRVIFRRAMDFLTDLGLALDLSELASWHAKSLRGIYPELSEHQEDVSTILEVERKKYANARERSTKIVENLRKRKDKLLVGDLIQLYDSDGITPEVLKMSGLEFTVPLDFYKLITERHSEDKHKGSETENSEAKTFDLMDVTPTDLLFYKNRDQFEFEAKVLKIVKGAYVILDSTAFFARAGGQEPDHGTINDLAVDDVIKINNIVLHHILDLDGRLEEGETIRGKVNSERRSLIMRHHTATHIVNGATRRVLGPWVWQHSAFKDEDMARLDVTHFAHLNRDQVFEIERLSNEVVRKNLPVTIQWMPRSDAEKQYGFRLYQGGVAPVKELRIVNIEGWDVEACGGTHCSYTGEVGLIKITKSERVQDGVERLQYVAGEAAVLRVEKEDSLLMDAASLLNTATEKLSASISNLQKESDSARASSKHLAKKLAELMINEIPRLSKDLPKGLKYYDSLWEEGLDFEYHKIVGDRLSRTSPSLVYLALFEENSRTRIVVFCGEEAQKNGARAGEIAKDLAKSLGGSGGGDARFAQGGSDQRPAAIPDFRAILLNRISD
ncbi:MAG: alanine--tRNA ligase [Thaumarchaeota archaeon]|nr:alanine--tRNA ligase [Nitrososphaerota archaeon]